MPALLKQPTTVSAQIDFLDPALEEVPYSCLGPPARDPPTNIESYPVDVEITDLRSIPDYLHEFTTATSGFQIVEHESACLDEIDSEEGKQKYFKEMEQLLLASLPGSTRVQVFNSTIRRKKHNAPAAGTARTPENTGPVSRAHNDNTPMSGARRVLAEMEDEGEELSKGRCQIINVWRPLSYPAVDCPLAAMDYRTLDAEKDLVPTDLILSNEGGRKGQNYSVLHSPAQKWYYLSEQRPDEAIIFKIYDSLVEPGLSQLTPHSAFVNPLAPADALPRQSIEIRALVFY
ncbi:hypothetical protein BCR35DRAFT_289397 [Leucosporidium creatinivorum]|uniref:Methyltransferase n=1 Tax=Leucosporidium creatinivorum TaxID=106004 RepID=A0A1Y2FX93_9BASI|nr:hypothetical protein BCR35DRAFT_289397 [Leucosporidium creatinivorum]